MASKNGEVEGASPQSLQIPHAPTHPQPDSVDGLHIQTANEDDRPQLTPMMVEDAIDASNPNNASAQSARAYLKGWRLYLLTFGLCLSLFLSTMETTIVSTSLVSITNALGGFDQRDWVVTSYLITYTGFLIIYAKFSDILGRKIMILIALAFFTIFSIVCGSISNMQQLIVFRALQGLGASGIYSMVTVIQPELVPPEQWGTYIAVTALVYVLSSVLGPILGGVINDNTSWRWVFLLNAPAGAIATGIIAFCMPTHFPNQGNPSAHVSLRIKFSRATLARLDGPGSVLLIAFSILIVFAFEEAGSRYAWASGPILGTLVSGTVCFLAFLAWEHYIGRPSTASVQEPVFPLRLMKDRIFAGLILVAFFTGPPFMTVLINLPQRFQAVDGATAFEAGVHLLPMLLASPVATAVSGQLVGKLKLPPFYMLLFATSLQILGIGLSSSIHFQGGTLLYGYEVLMGFGFGMGLVTLIIYTPLVVDRSDMAVTMGAITQIRVLGGTIGLAISATILNNHLAANLPTLLDANSIQEISDSVQYINTLPDSTRDAVRQVFADGYTQQLRVMLYFSAVVWLSVMLLVEKKPRRVTNIEGL
ncbi:drug resistance transporter EmrB/QacA subfamily [Xylariales sp. PMI_506]|nr:drug resistance transporter EmrB/QacA subfamily [Xylariales sp. PMI_506]